MMMEATIDASATVSGGSIVLLASAWGKEEACFSVCESEREREREREREEYAIQRVKWIKNKRYDKIIICLMNSVL